jgi:glycosyltransferase 2 family protein
VTEPTATSTDVDAPTPPLVEPVPISDDAGVPERRPLDVGRLVVAVVGLVLAGLWAQTGNDVDANLFAVVNGLPEALDGVARVLAALGSIWFAVAVVVVLLIVRWFPAARDSALAAGGAWLIALGCNELFGTRSASSLGITVRTGSGPAFPAATVAVATALFLALSPYLIRPLRRAGVVILFLVALSAMYLGTGLASDVLGGFFLGIAAGAAVHVAFGAPGGRPTAAQVAGALGELGFDVAAIAISEIELPRATVMDAVLASDAPVRVVAFGRDQRDGQFAAKLWHKLLYKDPGLPVFGSRLQQVEHIAYALMLAEQAGVHAPHLLKTGLAGPDAALLVTDIPAGRTLDDLGDALTDEVLATVWAELGKLHDAGIAHGDLEPDRIIVDDDGRAGFVDLGTAAVTADTYFRNRDVAALLTNSALIVGNERALAAAMTAVGSDRLALAIPLVQPAALPKATGRGVKHLGKVLKQLRTDAAAAAGVEDVAPLKVKRLSLVNIGMLAGVLVALAIAIPSLKGVNWSSVEQQFETAVWGWAVLALILYPLVPVSWGTALMGCVNTDLPFIPTVLVQLACTFLNLITPNGIGGTALQLDYLHKEGVPVASGASAMVLSTGVGGAIQMILFLIAASITATSLDNYDTGGSVTLGAIAVGAALIGIVLAIPKVRGKVVPAVTRALRDIWAVLRNPKKGAQLIGGDTAGNLIYPALLGLCLMAFGVHLNFAQLVVVQVGAGMLGNLAPVPGGIGVQEAALTAGLTAFGVEANTALATVLVFRGITFALPPVFGYFTLQALRRRGYA